MDTASRQCLSPFVKIRGASVKWAGPRRYPGCRLSSTGCLAQPLAAATGGTSLQIHRYSDFPRIKRGTNPCLCYKSKIM